MTGNMNLSKLKKALDKIMNSNVEDVVHLLNISCGWKVLWDVVDELDEGGESLIGRAQDVYY